MATNNITPEEFADLRAMAAKVQDNALRPFFTALVEAIGRVSGLDASEEDKRIAQEAQDRADAQRQADEAAEAAREEVRQAEAQKARQDLFISMFGPTPFPATAVTVNPSAAPPAADSTPTAKPAPTTPASSATKDAS